MSASKQAIWAFLALLGVALSIWHFNEAEPVRKLDAHTLKTTTDIVITDLTVRQFDASGKPVHYLQTPLMHHIPLDDTNWLKKPHILVSRDAGPPWEIKALEATATHGGEKIVLSQQVSVFQPKSEHSEESRMQTNELIYYPKKQFATTPDEVTLEQPGRSVQSVGMNAYLAEKRIQFLSNARGTYEPKRG